MRNILAIFIVSALSLGSAQAAVSGGGSGQNSNSLSIGNGQAGGSSQGSAAGTAQGGIPQLPQVSPADLAKAAGTVKDKAAATGNKLGDIASQKPALPMDKLPQAPGLPLGQGADMLGKLAGTAQGASVSGQAEGRTQGDAGQMQGGGQFSMNGSGGRAVMNASGQASPAGTSSGQLKFGGQMAMPQPGFAMPRMPQVSMPQAPQLPLPRL